jgi:hypothetical protein
MLVLTSLFSIPPARRAAPYIIRIQHILKTGREDRHREYQAEDIWPAGFLLHACLYFMAVHQSRVHRPEKRLLISRSVKPAAGAPFLSSRIGIPAIAESP